MQQYAPCKYKQADNFEITKVLEIFTTNDKVLFFVAVCFLFLSIVLVLLSLEIEAKSTALPESHCRYVELTATEKLNTIVCSTQILKVQVTFQWVTLMIQVYYFSRNS